MSCKDINYTDNTRDCLGRYRAQLLKLIEDKDAPMFIRREDVARMFSIGLTKANELIAESGALVKFGRSARVNRVMFLTYIYEKYVCENASA